MFAAGNRPWRNSTSSGVTRQTISTTGRRKKAAVTRYSSRKAKTTNYPTRAASVKLTKKKVESKTRTLPRLRFTDQKLSSFGGLLVFQALFQKLELRDRLRACFRSSDDKAPAYAPALVFLALVVHILLGYRTLRDMEAYRDDPLVLRLLGWDRWPDVSTVSRALTRITDTSLDRLRRLCRELVLDRLAGLQPRRITLDFDGSVLATSRHAEGTAVGYNRRKKGQRSYYPLFCTIAQTGQVFDFLHRSGNVHDSNGAKEFFLECIRQVRAVLPGVLVEIRMDSAFFSDEILSALREAKVEYTVSVPFLRLPEMKSKIEKRCRWHRVNEETGFFELKWKPKSWNRRARFLVIRTLQPVQRKQPLQLDLFEPREHGYVFKVVVTNKTISAHHVVAFHEGRGAQEAVFGELKSEGQMDYVPVRKLAGNQAFLLAVIFAHNLNRELQMQDREPQRKTTQKRAPLWQFDRLATFRRRLIQRAGRLTRPQGILTLTLGMNQVVQQELERILGRLQPA